MDKKAEKRSSGNMKILNDQRLRQTSSSPNKSVNSTGASLPTKQINMSIAKAKANPPKRKNMDHYVLHIQNIKGETDEGQDECQESIDFILKNQDDETEADGEQPVDDITEEIQLDSEDDDNEKNDETLKNNSKDVVEHVCGKCYKTFRRFNGLKKHLDFCKFYSGYHLRKAQMLKNLSKIEKDAVVMENKDICFCCGESYDTFHLGHINCPDCPKSFKTQASYERHIFITHSENDDFPCTICNAKLRSEKLMKLHIEQHRNRGKPFACKICGREFTRSYHLKRHQKFSSCSANENDAMSCKVCSKVFYRLDNLRAHLKYHLGTQVTKKPEYMCPICKNCFYSLSTLNIHTRTHTGERPFDCDLCEKKFSSLVALKKHRRYHTGEKPYTCSVCSQSFAVKEVLNRHMKRHTNDRPHVCPECGKSFIQATQLRTHAKTHIKPFECSYCDEKFKTEKSMQRHEKTHKSNRKRRSKAPQRTDCVICDKNFESAELLHFHILKVHEADPEDVMNLKPANSATPAKTAASTKTEADKANGPSKTNKINNNNDNSVSANRKILSKVYKLDEVDGGGSEVTKKSKPATTSLNGKKIVPVAISKTQRQKAMEKKAKTENSATANDGIVIEEYVLNDADTVTTFTIIPLESKVGEVIETITTDDLSGQALAEGSSILTGTRLDIEIPRRSNNSKKSLAASLAAAIADDDDGQDNEEEEPEEEQLTAEDIKLKENVRKLLDMLVDNVTLKKFGWPDATEEMVLCKVIENCGHDLSEDAENYKFCDYATRMREYVKLLFTVVIHNDSIKELLNNYTIDEVIEYVLGTDDDDDEDNEANDNDRSETDDKDGADDKAAEGNENGDKTQNAGNKVICLEDDSMLVESSTAEKRKRSSDSSPDVEIVKAKRVASKLVKAESDKIEAV